MGIYLSPYSMKFTLIPALLGVTVLSACNGQVSQKQPVEPAPVAEQQQVAKASYKAGAIQKYTSAAYAQALADGKTVVIDFHADWCSTCAANAPGIKAAFESTGNTNVVGFIADYDTETTLLGQFKVSMQSTLVKVRGNDPQSAQKIDTLGPGPLTQEQVVAFIQS